MENLKIEVEETKTYWERMKSAIFWNLLIVIGAFVFVSIIRNNNSISFFIPVLILFIGMIIYSSDSLCACYITAIEISENRLHIAYKKRNKDFEIDDTIDQFTFKKGIGSKLNGQTSYLGINYKNNSTIRQYNKWGWEKDCFLKTLDYLSKRNLLLQKYFFGLIEKKQGAN